MEVRIVICDTKEQVVWAMRMEAAAKEADPQLVALLLGSRVRNPRQVPKRAPDGCLELRLNVEEPSLSTQMLAFSGALKPDLRGAMEINDAKAVVAVFVNGQNLSLVIHQDSKPGFPS